MTELNYHIMKNVIIINYNGRVFNIQRNHAIADNIIEMIKAKDFDGIIKIVDKATQINNLTGEEFEIVDGVLYSFGDEVEKYIADLIVDFYEEQLPYKYLLNFWNNVKENPSSRSRECLYRFLEANHFPLTEDGKFIAYKKVNSNMKDNYTGTLDNSIGAIVKMDRENVNADPEQTCSCGLHVASYDYAQSYSGQVLIEVKVNPRDVVAVPYDYDNAKCRCCEYEVMSVAKEEKKEIVIIDEPVVRSSEVEDLGDPSKVIGGIYNEPNLGFTGLWKDILSMVEPVTDDELEKFINGPDNPFLGGAKEIEETVADIIDDVINRNVRQPLTQQTLAQQVVVPTTCIVNRKEYSMTKINTPLNLNSSTLTRRSPSGWPLGIVEAFNNSGLTIKAIYAEYSTVNGAFHYYVHLHNNTLVLVKSKV